MYPFITLQESLQLVLEELLIDESRVERTKWKPHDIVKLTRVCMEMPFKTWEDNILTQTDGSPILNPFHDASVVVMSYTMLALPFHACFYGKELLLLNGQRDAE